MAFMVMLPMAHFICMSAGFELGDCLAVHSLAPAQSKL